MNSFDKLKKESKSILNSIPELISKTFPIPGKFRRALLYDIGELSKLLTNSRGERSLSYLNRPNFLSAYLYYFLPWNIYRLCVLLSSIELKMSAGDLITDLGCGPLTFVSALWIARPDLRVTPLEFNCVDRSGPALEAGKKFFAALCEFTNSQAGAWKINLIKKDIKIKKNTDTKKAALVCAVNMFNEHYDRISHNNKTALRDLAENAALLMHTQASESASILTVEPGIPQSGRFISFLREAFIELGRMPSSPCAHTAGCPLLSGANDQRQHRQPNTAKQRTKKERWCHFAFETADAPKDLMSLSAAAKLQKDRLVFSFLHAGAVSKAKTQDEITANSADVRVISDAFPLPGNKYGRYGCSERGLTLITGEKRIIEMTGSLSLCSITGLIVTEKRDEKSGAVIMELK